MGIFGKLGVQNESMALALYFKRFLKHLALEFQKVVV
jgi:hypothetical protein